MAAPTLTIGIPTYRRPDSIVKLIADIRASGHLSACDVLVVDDSAQPEISADIAARHAAMPEVRYLINERNRGYGPSFLRLLKECTTDYLLFCADDDTLHDATLPAIREALARRSPAIASPQFLIGGTVYRGVDEERPIRPDEYFTSCAHAPGMIYAVESCRRHIGAIEAEIEAGNSVALLYPQMMLCILLLIEGAECWFVPYPSATEGEGLESGIRDASGNHYAGLSSRVRQWADFDGFIVRQEGGPVRDAIEAQSRLLHLSQCLYADPALFEKVSGGATRNHLKNAVSSLLPGGLRGRARRFYHAARGRS